MTCYNNHLLLCVTSLLVITFCSEAQPIFQKNGIRNSENDQVLNSKKTVLRRRAEVREKFDESTVTKDVAVDNRSDELQELARSFAGVKETPPITPATNLSFATEKKHNKEQEKITRRFFVQAHNENGKNYATQISHEVLNHFDDNLVVVRLDHASVRALEEHQDIESVDEDYPIYPLSVSEKTKKQTRASFALKNDLLDDMDNISERGGADDRMLLERTPYGINMIQADQLEAGNHNVIVCIIDSGVALEHPDIDSSLITGDNNNRKMESLLWNRDLDGHGTHVAGLMSSLIGNGQGIRGIGKIHIHVTRGLDDGGGGFESDVRRSIQQCIDKGANIVSLSLGGPRMSDRMNRTYTSLVQDNGIMLFGASGNDGETTAVYPAAHPDSISVGAVGFNRDFTYFSNYNDQVELAAPGLNILSTSVSSIAVHTEDFSYPAYQAGTTVRNIEGPIRYCGYGTELCQNAEGKVCLVRRKEATVPNIVQNCVNGGGIGLIMFWERDYGGSWTGVETSIPVLVVDRTSGYELIYLLLRGADSARVKVGFAGVSNDLAREYTYTYYTGTSMSCPHAAAAAALVWSHFPNCNHNHIRYALAYTALDQGEEGCDNHYGYGIVQARAAYEYLLENECTEDWPKRSYGGCSTV